MDVLGSIDLTGLLDVGIRGERLLDETAQLLFVGGVPLDRFNNQAMRRAAGLFGKRPKTRAQFWGQANGRCSCHGHHLAGFRT